MPERNRSLPPDIPADIMPTIGSGGFGLMHDYLASRGDGEAENGDVVTALMPKACDRCKKATPSVLMRLHPIPPDGAMVRDPLCADCQRILCGYAVTDEEGA
jgi:hypothetical protein